MKNIIYFICFFSLAIHASSEAQIDIKSFTFGHSLLDHRPPLIATPSDETTVAHWMHLLAQEAGHTYQSTGQYGYLPSHANLPPSSNWGYDIVASPWDSEQEPFADADFNHVLMTALNYVQWQAPTESYYEMPGVTPINTSQTIINWLSQEAPGIKIYIYENWPDMAQYIANGVFPPTPSDMVNYHNYTMGDFHDWWIEYQDSLLISNPIENVRMIPAGPILCDLHANTVVSQIPITELYEDDAPHGRATTYFLASLITYMATYEEKAPANYVVPSIIHPIVQNNYNTIVNHIWDELLDFNLPNGDSRVFFNTVLPVELKQVSAKLLDDDVILEWLTLQEFNTDRFDIEYSFDELTFHTIGKINAKGNSHSLTNYAFIHRSIQHANNYYRLKILDKNGTFEYSKTIHVQQKMEPSLHTSIYPNPSQSGKFSLNIAAPFSDDLQIKVFNISGELIHVNAYPITEGDNQIALDLQAFGKGIFILKASTSHSQQTHQIINQ